MKALFTLPICLLAAAVAWALPALAQQPLPKTQVKVIGPQSETLTWKVSIQPFFSEELPKLSNGQITADLVSMTALGLKGPEVFRMIKIGVADLGATGTSYASGEIPEMDGLDLAGLVQDVGTLRKVVDAYTPVLDRIMRERAGVRMLAVWPTVQQALWCAVPIASLNDIRGKKVRVLGSTQADFIRAGGGEPITMAPSEVVTAMQRGVIDCAITGTESGNRAKWPEVATHLYPINLGWSLWILVANEKSWNAVDPKARDFIMENLKNVMIKRAWDIADEGSNQGIWCSVGDSRCTWDKGRGSTRYNIKLVPYTSADDQRRKELADATVLPAFAKRCGEACTSTWNDTVGKILGMTAKVR